MWQLTLLLDKHKQHKIPFTRYKSQLLGNLSINCIELWTIGRDKDLKCLQFVDNEKAEIFTMEETGLHDFSIVDAKWSSNIFLIMVAKQLTKAEKKEEEKEIRQIRFEYFEMKNIFMFFLLHLNQDFDDDLLQDAIENMND